MFTMKCVFVLLYPITQKFDLLIQSGFIYEAKLNNVEGQTIIYDLVCLFDLTIIIIAVIRSYIKKY